MKRNFYILSFTILGILLGFMVHAIVELGVIYLIVSNPDKWRLGLSFDTWFFIHNVWAILMVLVGITFGFKQGKYWWRVIYIEKRYFKKFTQK